MELINLSYNKVKYFINDDGTLVVRIGEDYLLKISWGEIRSLDMIISDQQSEALGMAKTMIEKINKGIDTHREPEVQQVPHPETEKSTFSKETKKRFVKFLESYLSEDDETIEVFDSSEICSVLRQEFLLSELQDEFGTEYAFKELDDNKVSVALLITPDSD